MKGWTFPTATARKAHYFDFEKDLRSLCRRYMMLAVDPKRVEDNKHSSPDNCKVCNALRLAMEGRTDG